MIKDNMEKQGEFMSSKFVSIALLLIGFIIVMLIFPALLNEKEVDREICHDSVLLRGALPDNLNLKEVANLKCTTRKVCLTSKTFGKGDCKDEKGFEKGEYETIRVSTGEDVNRFVARELAGCWSMMGNGEIQIFTRENSQKKSCVVCSRISFDKELKAELKNEVDGLGNYMLTHEVPNQNMSYFKYLTGSTPTEFSENLRKEGLSLSESSFKEIFSKSFSTEQKSIIFMEVGSSSFWSDFLKKFSAVGWGAIGLKTGAVVGALIPIPGTTAIGATAGLATGVIYGWISGQKAGDAFVKEKFGSSEFFVDYNADFLEDLECTSFENIP